jgi:aspartyl-tRNA(Asn)/glutamyl-tRNA(Gln) amidotransferase subunit A
VTGPFTGRTIAEVAAALRSGADDPVALLGRALAATDASQPVLNAFVTVDASGARAAAAQARDELAAGVDRGPLHGVPVAVKDIVDTAGLVTTMGSAHFAGNLPARDAEVVTRLRAAGAVIVGKTTTHEFAYGPTGDVAANGPCANPHDPARMAGGSSAGSAAAVAAGLVPLAVGTDTGGSVRIPAALCGVAGLRPSPEGVPVTGVFPLSWSLDTVGPIAANLADVVIGWRVLGGQPVAAPTPARAPRIGVPAGPWFDKVDGAVGTVVGAWLSRLDGAVRTVPVPDAEELFEIYRVVQSAEAMAVHADRMARAPDRYQPETLARLRAAEQVPAWAYATALRRLRELRAQAVHRLAGVDVLVLPTVPVPAPPLGTREADVGGGWTHARDALLAFTVPWSVLGLPALSLPAGAAGGLPVGVQLVGLPGADDELLALAAQLQPRCG